MWLRAAIRRYLHNRAGRTVASSGNQEDHAFSQEAMMELVHTWNLGTGQSGDKRRLCRWILGPSSWRAIQRQEPEAIVLMSLLFGDKLP